MGSIPYSVDSVAGSSRSLNRTNGGVSPTLTSDDPTFWVPHGLHRQSSICHSEMLPSSAGNIIYFV